LYFVHSTQCSVGTTLIPSTVISHRKNQCVPEQTTATSARIRSADSTSRNP
jgi:hypothetical protein